MIDDFENKPLVSIQILNWNRCQETLRAIKSALYQSYNNIEVVVVDNGSEDNSIEEIRKNFSQVKLVQLNKNYGCPGGRNRGIEACCGEYIFFCDNDGVLHVDAVKNAMQIMEQDSKCAIVTGLVKDFADETEIDTLLPIDKPKSYNIHVFQGGISLHKKSIYHKISMFPDDYMYGGEETFLALKVLDAGLLIKRSLQVILWHKKSTLARNLGRENLQAMGNALATAYQLYPLKNFLLFFLYYWFKYPFYAKKSGVLKEFFIEAFPTLRRLEKYERNPVSSNTYKAFSNLKKTS